MLELDFHRAEGGSELISEADRGAPRQPRSRVDEHRFPAAAMIDDDHSVIVAERSGKEDRAGCRSGNGLAPACRQQDPA